MVRVIVQVLKILTISVTAILVATAGLRVFDYAVDRSLPDDVGEPVEIRIGEDETEQEVADKLAEAGLIRSKLLFTGQVKLTGRAPEPGEYRLTKGMSVQQIIDRITGAEVAQATGGEPESEAEGSSAETFKATIVEGWRIEQVAEEFAKGGMEGGYEAFMDAVQDVDRNRYEFLAELPSDASLEGYLFPDTYDFVVDDPAYNIQLMLDNFDAQFTPDMRDRARQMNLDIRTVLTIASLVEREAKLPAERPVIADIYLKRYAENWELEADPTVQYVVGTREDWWPSPLTDEQLHVDNPYNTYMNPGLPPGPICNPGIGSIQAVLFPEETPYYFFVATGDESGSHYFAATQEEHQANVEKYRQAAGGD